MSPLYKVGKCMHNGDVVSVRQHVSSPILLNGFRLNLVLQDCTGS